MKCPLQILSHSFLSPQRTTWIRNKNISLAVNTFPEIFLGDSYCNSILFVSPCQPLGIVVWVLTQTCQTTILSLTVRSAFCLHQGWVIICCRIKQHLTFIAEEVKLHSQKTHCFTKGVRSWAFLLGTQLQDLETHKTQKLWNSNTLNKQLSKSLWLLCLTQFCIGFKMWFQGHF